MVLSASQLLDGDASPGLASSSLLILSSLTNFLTFKSSQDFFGHLDGFGLFMDLKYLLVCFQKSPNLRIDVKDSLIRNWVKRKTFL